MSQNPCPKCNKEFKYPSKLREHLNRKTPCAPIVDREQLSEVDKKKPYECRYCGRTFSTAQASSRHMRQRCPIATTDAGMEKLLDHTLQKQLTAQAVQKQMAALAVQNATLQAQVEKLTVMMERQLAVAALPPVIGTLNTGPVTTNFVTNNIQVNIIGFDREDRIRIPVALVKAAFSENPRLIEYCHMEDDARTNAETAAPFVLEALLDLIRRAHKDPVYRNVYLNPKRADQVMVFVASEDEASTDNGKQRWEVRTLVEAIRLLFDGVASGLHKIVVTDQERQQLPIDIQSAASWVPNLYDDAPDRFVQDGKVPMAAHLQNTRPTQVAH